MCLSTLLMWCLLTAYIHINLRSQAWLLDLTHTTHNSCITWSFHECILWFCFIHQVWINYMWWKLIDLNCFEMCLSCVKWCGNTLRGSANFFLKIMSVFKTFFFMTLYKVFGLDFFFKSSPSLAIRNYHKWFSHFYAQFSFSFSFH